MNNVSLTQNQPAKRPKT